MAGFTAVCRSPMPKGKRTALAGLGRKRPRRSLAVGGRSVGPFPAEGKPKAIRRDVSNVLILVYYIHVWALHLLQGGHAQTSLLGIIKHGRSGHQTMDSTQTLAFRSWF